MEPIKAAIEKARRQRGEHSSYSFSRGVSRKAEELADLKNIEYTCTFTHEVSRAELIANRVIAQEKKHIFADAYRMMRTQILSKLRHNNWSTIGITSSGPGQGKSLTATNLAISIARNVNHTVLLADFDLRRPNIRNLFNYEREQGLIDCIENDVPVEQVLFTPGIDGLVVLPGGHPVDESSELLGTPKVASMVREMKERYKNRIVIFDLPPMLLTDDVFEIMPMIDSMLFIVEEGKTKREEVTRCMDLLKGHNLLGTVLNKSHDKMSSYSYKTAYY
ncbi:MAG: CpsD/CapB family tyrosine-protein kinase [Gammaproteobacteria bacterium]|nr:CpsD/CapB family tyrosine-protein kinase [Gammaproteobacteria bacterium]